MDEDCPSALKTAKNPTGQSAQPLATLSAGTGKTLAFFYFTLFFSN
jgi:hypothetical protein